MHEKDKGGLVEGLGLQTGTGRVTFCLAVSEKRKIPWLGRDRVERNMVEIYIFLLQKAT